MRKTLLLAAALLLLAASGLCSVASLNVWVRYSNFEIVNNPGVLQIFNCHGKLVKEQVFKEGHIETSLPPGCYIVKAVHINCGNYFTDKVGIIAKCGEEVCVNLIMPEFRPRFLPRLEDVIRTLPRIGIYHCATSFLPPLLINASIAGISPQDMDRAVDVIARAAGMDKRMMLDAVRADMSVFEENLRAFDEKDQKEIRETIGRINQYLPNLPKK